MMVAAGVLAYVVPNSGTLIVYDRAAILSGEVWRLMTGNWVHFSVSHLVYDSATLGIAGWMIERRGYPYYKSLYILAPILIGAGLLAAQPDIQFYGGLSGIACGAVVYLALHGLREAGPWRWICLTVLLLTTGKIVLESAMNAFAFVKVDDVPFSPVPLSHVLGALTALLIFCWPYARDLMHPKSPVSVREI
ncbi:MAG: rhombosortase [Nitrospirae bacterium]|nr:rhombosortase [Nitrospirota bacterium]